MKFRNQFLKYHAPVADDGSNDGSGSGGSGGSDRDAAPSAEEFKALKLERDALLAASELATSERTAAEERARVAAEDAARKAGDTEALDKSWQEKHGKLEADWKAKNDRLNGELQGILVNNVAQKAALEIAVDADCGELLMSKFKEFLTVAERDGKMQTVVVDKDGKPSAMTVDELKKSIMEKYPRLVKGSPAGGAGGASFSPSGKLGVATGDMVSRAKAIISNIK
jgi:hypothetical protein